MKITEFILPHGKKEEHELFFDTETESKASELASVGFKFEIEILRSGVIHMDCTRYQDELPIFTQLANNDDTLLSKIKLLVETSFERWKNVETNRIETDSRGSS